MNFWKGRMHRRFGCWDVWEKQWAGYLKAQGAAQSGQSGVGVNCLQEISTGSAVLLKGDQPAVSRPASGCQWCVVILPLEDFCGNQNFAFSRKSSSSKIAAKWPLLLPLTGLGCNRRVEMSMYREFCVEINGQGCASGRDLSQGWFPWVVFSAIRSRVSESIRTAL